MAKYLFDNCCFCIDLRVGSLIIGYLNLISSAIESVTSIMVIAGAAVLCSSTDPDHRTIGVALLAVGVVTLLVAAVFLAFVIALLVGLHKNKPGHVKAYLIYCYFFLLVSLILVITTLATGPYNVVAICFRFLGLTLNIYCVMVIRSYYYQMLGEAAGPPQYNS